MRKLLPLVALLLWGGLAAADPAPVSLQPRRIAGTGGRPGLPPRTPVESVIVKFQEGTQVRLRDGRLAVGAPGARERARLASLGLAAEQVETDLRAVADFVASRRQGAGLSRLFAAGEEALAAYRARGEARSGRELADLDLYYRLPLPPGTLAADVADLVHALGDLASVEVAYAQPPPVPAVDIPPVTPDFTPSEGYLDPAPAGIDARHAWTIAGGLGAGVKIVDTEGAWNTAHEDLPPLFHVGVNTTQPGWFEHGTAVLGVMVAGDNGYGTTGIVSQAQAGTESFANQSIASAIANAAIAAGAGGIVLVEIQSSGPSTPNTSCGCAFGCCDCIPMEFFPGEFDAIAQATANGTIIVEAGANGATDLDDPVYGGIFDRAQRDSGALLVGASDGASRSPTCFTNFGSRVDLHGWGFGVFTSGYGDLFSGGGDPRQYYTQGFSGTSSATPIVSGAAAALQGVALAHGLPPLAPSAMRELLRSTGTPQTADPRQIGPLPDLRAAIDSLLATVTPPPASDFFVVTACRTVDTRGAAGPFGGPALATGVKRTFALAGRCGIPASAVAVSANVTIAGPTAAGHLSLYSADLLAAGTSTVNFTAGQVRANNAILELAADGLGSIEVLPVVVGGGTVHLIIDVNGYFEPSAAVQAKRRAER